MSPVDVYMMYCTLKAHFSKSDYNYFKYEGKTRIKRESFYKRKDRIFFLKLSKKYGNCTEYIDIKNYLLANFVSNPDGYVARFDDKTYEDWLYRKQNFYTKILIDLIKSEPSGLIDARNVLKKIKGISFIELNEQDVVRHKLVKDIIKAYNKGEKK